MNSHDTHPAQLDAAQLKAAQQHKLQEQVAHAANYLRQSLAATQLLQIGGGQWSPPGLLFPDRQIRRQRLELIEQTCAQLNAEQRAGWYEIMLEQGKGRLTTWRAALAPETERVRMQAEVAELITSSLQQQAVRTAPTGDQTAHQPAQVVPAASSAERIWTAAPQELRDWLSACADLTIDLGWDWRWPSLRVQPPGRLAANLSGSNAAANWHARFCAASNHISEEDAARLGLDKVAALLTETRRYDEEHLPF